MQNKQAYYDRFYYTAYKSLSTYDPEDSDMNSSGRNNASNGPNSDRCWLDCMIEDRMYV